MTQIIDPHIVYPDATFFLDYINHMPTTSGFFEHAIENLDSLVEHRRSTSDMKTRHAVCDALLDYNRTLDASSQTLTNIHRLREASTLCVISGQQAGFLGGPALVLYKIASTLRTAAWLADRLNQSVVPLFWLATEDHDFAEINHIRWLDESGAARTISFSWEQEGRPIEDLQLAPAILQAFSEAMQKIPFGRATDAAIFHPEEGDDYGTWHARIWSRLFARHGLILVEPRVLRPLAKPFFERAMSDAAPIRECLKTSAARLSERGFHVPLDPDHSGTLFDISSAGKRRRSEQLPARSSGDAIDVRPETLSTDAALRPLLADALLPTIANILGPSELAYHAMLMPLYKHWEIPQPLAVPRRGATLITEADHKTLVHTGLKPIDLFDPHFSPSDVMRRLASHDLSHAFHEAHGDLKQALLPLKDRLAALDPGLEARWRQTVDQAGHQVDKLMDRAIRAELAGQGISIKRLQGLKLRLRPTEKPQERVLSAFFLLAQYGVEWLEELIAHGEPTRFQHQLIVTKESHE